MLRREGRGGGLIKGSKNARGRRHGRVPRSLPQLSRHLSHSLDAWSHLPRETHFGEVVKAEQLRLLLSQRQQLRDERPVVEFPRRRAADEGPIKLFAQHPIAAMFHERLEQRNGETIERVARVATRAGVLPVESPAA